MASQVPGEGPIAVSAKKLVTSVYVSRRSATSNSKAATAAALGLEADVPKKFVNPRHVRFGAVGRGEVGLLADWGAPNGTPASVNRIVPGPWLEKSSIVSGVSHGTAPIENAKAAWLFPARPGSLST